MVNYFNFNEKLILGTAQFASNYGVANKNRYGISKKKIAEILNFCKKQKILFIETAHNYLNAEKKLGNLEINKFNIITKLPKLNLRLGKNKLYKQINSFFLNSYNNLSKKNIYGLMLHSGEQLLSNKGKLIYNALLKIKEDNNIKSIGISVHNPNCLAKIIKRYKLDIVQLPFNILDNRLYDLKIISLLKKNNIKIHCRSVFLQGLLLSRYFNVSSYLKKYLRNFFYDTGDLLDNKLKLCLRHVLSHKEIDKFVIGIDNIDQLMHICKIMKNITPNRCNKYKINNIKVIDPIKWT